MSLDDGALARLPRPTPRGGAAAVTALALLLLGLGLESLPILAGGLLLTALLGLAAARLGGVELTIRRRLGEVTTREGETVRVHLEVEASGGSRTFLEVRDELPPEMRLASGSNYAFVDLAEEAAAGIDYEVASPVKGRFQVGPVRFRLEDAFGFFHREASLPDLDEVRVYPRGEDLRNALARAKHPMLVTGGYLVGKPGGGTSFFALREYVPGDPMRAVNWKASAKAGRDDDLIVNEWEHESQTVVTILYDAREASRLGTREENANVRGARAVLSLVDYFVDFRDRIRLVTYGDGLNEVKGRGAEEQAHEVRESLVLADGEGETTLGDVVEEILPSLPTRTPVVLVSNLAADPTVADAVRRLRSRDLYVTVVSVDLPPVEDGVAYDLARTEREAALAEVRGYGAAVVDWRAGEPLNAAIEREVMR